MDEIDSRILHELQSNSRESNTEIAKRLGISEGTVRKRIDSLIKDGTIARFSTILSTKSGFMAFIFIRTDTRIPTSTIVTQLRQIEGTGIIYETAGPNDIVIRAATSSAETFNDLIDRIRAIEGIVHTESLTVLKVS